MLFHLSPVQNRASIAEHGLDPRRMGAAMGIAGNDRPELEGVYVFDEPDEADFWIRVVGGGLHSGGLDLWEIDDPGTMLRTGPHGFAYLPQPVPSERIRLRETFLPADDAQPSEHAPELSLEQLPKTVDGVNQTLFLYSFDDDSPRQSGSC